MNSICLLDNEYVSELLLKTLEKYRIPVFKKTRKNLSEGILKINQEQAKALISNEKTKIYSNADNNLAFVYANGCSLIVNQISFFKNKLNFRKNLSSVFPEYYFSGIKKSDMNSFVVPEKKELIVKPSVGFHSLGIKRISNQKEWLKSIPEILNEVEKYSKIFEDCVSNSSMFLLEEYISGEEYACDAFFDKNGKPVITGIYKHSFASENDSRDLVYYTNKKIIEDFLIPAKEILEKISLKTKLRNFPVHFEFRVTENKKIYPLEVNPLRFGGFGLADLTFYAFGINSYECFFLEKKPEWHKILLEKDNTFFAFVVGQTPDKFEKELHLIDEQKYKSSFKEIIEYVKIDYNKYKFFSTVFTKNKKLNEIKKYLYFDFNEYLKNK